MIEDYINKKVKINHIILKVKNYLTHKFRKVSLPKIKGRLITLDPGDIIFLVVFYLILLVFLLSIFLVIGVYKTGKVYNNKHG